jgi:hypothetical protein
MDRFAIRLGYHSQPPPTTGYPEPEPNTPVQLSLTAVGHRERTPDIGGIDITAPRLAHDM